MKILFCGLGGIGQRHLRCLRSILGNDLEAHAFRARGQKVKLRDDLTVDSSGNLETDYQLTLHASLEEGLACRPDAVFVCNPSNLHIQYALQAARSGCNVFIEKPLASSSDGVSELKCIVADKGLVCHVGYNFRFHPAVQRLKDIIDSGLLGNILSATSIIGEYLPAWHPYEDYRQMYASRRELGGGVILSQIHEFDLAYWFFGMPETIYSLGGKLSSLDINVEDVASSLMWINGQVGRFPLSIHQDFVRRPAERTFTVVGDRGVVRMDLRANELTRFDESGAIVEKFELPGFQRNQMFTAQARHFLECLAGRCRPLVGLADAENSLRLALAARESLESRREVKFS
jgi:predicted dehydrogenase